MSVALLGIWHRQGYVKHQPFHLPIWKGADWSSCCVGGRRKQCDKDRNPHTMEMKQKVGEDRIVSPSLKNVGQSRFLFSRPTVTTRLSASLIKMQINIKEAERCGWDRIRLAGSLGAASCLMFGYMNRDESQQYLGWGAEAAERSGGGGDDGGELLSQKGLKGWMSDETERRDLPQICARRPAHRKHMTGPPSLTEDSLSCFITPSLWGCALHHHTVGRFMTLC